MSARRQVRRGRDTGQAFVEYLMIVGILTAVIIAVTKIVVPFLGFLVVKLVQHMSVFVSSLGS